MSPHAILNDGNVVVVPTEKTSKLQDADTHMLHRSLKEKPYTVVAADGLYLTLSNGQEILDASSGAAVSCLGHNHPRVKEALIKQQDIVSYCATLFFSTQAAEDLADELIRGTEGKMARCFIVSSGSEAVEAAIKLSRQYFLELPTPQPQRTKFIARKESYHGTTMGALALGGHVARRKLYEPMLMGNSSRVSFCNAYRGKKEGESDADYVARLAQELDDEFQKQGPDTVCAFFAETVVGAAQGCVPAVEGYFKAMRAVCDKYGALFVLDEIMSGMGRCGTLHAWQQEGVVPDIQTIGKGLGGGYAPIAGLLINSKVVDVLSGGTGAFSHGQTYQGHPLACAAALEVQRVIREEGLIENCAAMGKLLGAGLKDRLADHPNVGNVRGKGLFWGIEFVKDKTTKEPFDPAVGIAMKVHETGMREPHNICLYPGTGSVDGVRGDHVKVMPAYTVTKDDIDLIVERVAKVIEDVFAKDV